MTITKLNPGINANGRNSERNKLKKTVHNEGNYIME